VAAPAGVQARDVLLQVGVKVIGKLRGEGVEGNVGPEGGQRVVDAGVVLFGRLGNLALAVALGDFGLD
jgi:hypothetical protein